MYRLVSLLFLVVAGCGGPKDVSLADPSVAPFLQAIAQVDRTSLGFTEISTNSRARLEGANRGYDAMLHIYGHSSRTIAFRRTDTGFRWTGEQEIHFGPGSYQTEDGLVSETISITYHTEHTDPGASGVPLRQVHVRYYGTDPRLADRRLLTLDDVKPVFEEWRKKR